MFNAATYRATPRDLALVAVFTALTAVLAMPTITISGIAPITLQTLGFMLAASLLGFPWGGASVALYVLLIVVGLPIGAGGRGGLAVLTGPTGGFLIGGIVGALVTGWLVDKWGRSNPFTVGLANIIGLVLVVYVIGLPWLGWRTGSGLFAKLTLGFQFVPGDLIKVVVTSLVVVTVARAYPAIATKQRA
ncbi:biotin transporter BioY [Tsukamurella ocularis]|uniref:biotin transporter BioY n=1 Tax=Tsukamurella ocularis TaxID=1970234 RepID=UPI002167DB30|nr:biotin transporter BioY [Tsukamurella ocularis]MCS3779182.1 biotin transport system substrate-specific component [Tsukamurella ocularis]MCS3787198.1 biotin transport system substrate-specific component [Tsukamurella ocularis]MCS3852589.1 biotin transport system substrate-specific component [Tsukamurella ocularis]